MWAVMGSDASLARRRMGLGAIAGVVACCALSVLAACDRAGETPARASGQSGKSQATTGVTGVTDLTRLRTGRSVITLFQNACANCHGAYGEMLAKPFVVKSDDALASTLDEMMRLRSGLKYDGDEFAGMLEYMNALRDDRAFVVLTSARDGRLAGEVSPGSRVLVRTRTGDTEASVHGHSWDVMLGTGALSVEWITARSASGSEVGFDPRVCAMSAGAKER